MNIFRKVTSAMTLKEQETATVEDDNKPNEPEAATAAGVEEPPTPPTPAAEPQEEPKQPLKDMPLEEQLSVWQKTSRKHEDQAKRNKQQLDKATADLTARETELLEARIENAKLRLRIDHPELSDKVIALCNLTDPDEIKAWGDQMSDAIGVKPATGAPSPVHPAVRDFNLARHRESNTPSGNTGSPSFNDLMRKHLEEARNQYKKTKE